MYLHNLQPQHLQELVNHSGIDLDIACLNFRSLSGINVYEYLLISEHIPRTNTGMVTNALLKRYAHITDGGWWCSGLDPINNYQNMEWGCFKPNQPRQNQKGKAIKYEHPPYTKTRIFCLRISLKIWQQIAENSRISLPENITINSDGEAEGFWPWVIKHNISLIICEGVKKAASLLSQGYVAIAIPGINSGYRVIKNQLGQTTHRQLIPDLEIFTRKKRDFYICFDFETKPKQITAVNNAISQLGYLLQQQNCPVKVVQLPGKEKGVDEFIIAKGITAFDKIYRQSTDLEIYIAKTKPHTELTIKPAVTVNVDYLGNLDQISFPDAGLVGIKSAKGTGKTTALLHIVKKAKNHNRPVLLITHRILLGKFLCEKVGIQWGIENTYYQTLGLCVDSLWKIKPENWQGAILILDEVEQSLWHLLNSNTCKEKRVKILRIFQQLISTVIKSGGLIIAQDADLSDISLEYLQNLSDSDITPWLVINDWKPQKGWDITFYDSPNPTPLIHQLELDLIAGRKCYVTTDSRCGRYSCETIEKYLRERLEKLRQKFPNSLVVSSMTTNTPGHAAVDFIAAINQKITDYQAVFVTPSLGTGISIDVQHFDRVYGIFQGVIPDSEARQALARVRDDVPRVVWCAKRGIGLIASGSTNYQLLSHWYQQNQTENLALLSPLHKIDVDLPLVYDPIHLRTWAKLSARVNASIQLYRQSMQDGLIADGHDLQIRSNEVQNNILRDLRLAFFASDPQDFETRKRLILEIVKVQKDWEQSRQKSKEIKRKIKEIKQQNQLTIARAVSTAKDIDYFQAEQLLRKHSLTNAERYQINKHRLRQRYGINVTPELKLKDDQGYYGQLLIHYYLTHESQYFHLRDQQEWFTQLSWGEGEVFLPDLKTYTLQVEAMRTLGMLQFLESDRLFRENDPDIIWLKNVVLQSSKHLKRALGIDLIRGQKHTSNISGIMIIKRLLGLLGLKLKCKHDVYKIDLMTLNDHRNEIFAIWQQRDELMLIHRSRTSLIIPGSDSCDVESVKLC
ncbi:DUF3854 domain-containing protein [Anabaena sp. FACHB-1237]|uniref:plasmid replication protein, CyRepA1 family n=1 Tax=Anabaena sp. FACHB-1237 TaxID=2692769 RepID=UPI001680A36D|nr:plasmid replication protein, CyRepA1 family [Anabaena sp. FACHB-1237]MBD2138146.1 DUF3854 domain-containing protein [Anabaena sp. FACHB-1237]